jgi:hypothetical protein
MDDMDRFIVENNVSAFFSKLACEPDIDRRAMLSRLLVEEENKFARLAGHLDSLDSYIAKCDAQIAKHRAFLDRGARSEDQQRVTKSILDNIAAIKDLLGSVRETSQRRLDGPQPRSRRLS